MHYDSAAIPDTEIPRAIDPPFQHLLDTYASEANKVISVWQAFTDADLEWRPHPQSSTVGEILRHQLLSERRFFAEFLGIPEAPAELVLPAEVTVEACRDRLRQMVVRRLPLLSSQPQAWWLESVPFFDVRRQRIWVFWRRVLHTCHHRTQLTVYLRLLGRRVPATYGPTADITWKDADPTHSVEAAKRP